MEFNTIPEEVLPVARAAASFYEDDGYDVSIEERALGFPYLPALVCRRGHETLIVECSTTLDPARVDRWSTYARTQSTDTRVSFFVSEESAYEPQSQRLCKQCGVGLVGVGADLIPDQVLEPSDLAMQVPVPELKSLSKNVRPHVSAAFKKLKGTDWRDGVRDIFTVVEEQARELLMSRVDAGSVIIVKNKKGDAFSVEDIEKATLGGLVKIYGLIQNANYAESMIQQSLDKINSNRIIITHKKANAKAEAQLRKNVAPDVNIALNCLELILQ